MPPVLDGKGTAKTEVSPMSGVGTGALASVREAEGGCSAWRRLQGGSHRHLPVPTGNHEEDRVRLFVEKGHG